MILVDADAVGSSIEPGWLVERIREGHRAGGTPSAERMLLPGPGQGEECLVWGGWGQADGLAVKAASVFAGNPARGLPSIHSVVILFDGETGAPVAAIHGEAFTRSKTAADSALGVDLLARGDASVLAVLGAGAQAETHVRFLLAVRPSLRRVVVANRTADRADELVWRLRALGIDAVSMSDRAEAVAGADIVTCLTTSLEPVLEGRWLRPGTHVDLVGSFTPDMREADDEAIRRARVFADTRRFTLNVVGDFVQAIAAGAMVPEDVVGDLFELVAGTVGGRRSGDEITVFKNGGGGHLDLMAARAFFDAAVAAGQAGKGGT